MFTIAERNDGAKWLGCSVDVCGVAFELTNRHGFIHQSAATFGFAKSRTNTTNRCGQRQVAFDHFHRFVVIALRDVMEVTLNINVRRAGNLARSLAIGIVVGEQPLQRGLARLIQCVAVGMNHHLWLQHAFAGSHDTELFNLDYTQIAMLLVSLVAGGT